MGGAVEKKLIKRQVQHLEMDLGGDICCTEQLGDKEHIESEKRWTRKVENFLATLGRFSKEKVTSQLPISSVFKKP
jgi:hypothetical protein